MSSGTQDALHHFGSSIMYVSLLCNFNSIGSLQAASLSRYSRKAVVQQTFRRIVLSFSECNQGFVLFFSSKSIRDDLKQDAIHDLDAKHSQRKNCKNDKLWDVIDQDKTTNFANLVLKNNLWAAPLHLLQVSGFSIKEPSVFFLRLWLLCIVKVWITTAGFPSSFSYARF